VRKRRALAVAYSLELHERTVIPYLQGIDLSREGRVILFAGLHRELREHADSYINDLERRLRPGSPFFEIDFVFRDPIRRVIHRSWFIVSDAAAQYGVLRVVYAEDFQGSPDLQ